MIFPQTEVGFTVSVLLRDINLSPDQIRYKGKTRVFICTVLFMDRCEKASTTFDDYILEVLRHK